MKKLKEAYNNLTEVEKLRLKQLLKEKHFTWKSFRRYLNNGYEPTPIRQQIILDTFKSL